mmetsp:Transcript_756/g.2431  ORF Transcript_756/g.2431 Transcript_756/m.2431 type:complete len:261 (-) Transcript_756:250-1032(-)
MDALGRSVEKLEAPRLITDDVVDLQHTLSSGYLPGYLRSRSYDVRLHAIGANIRMKDESSKNEKPDPYLKLFPVTQPGSKRKTAVTRNTLAPRWDEHFTFSNLEYDTVLCCEVKSRTDYKLGRNDVFGHMEFCVGDIMMSMADTPAPDIVSQNGEFLRFEMTGDKAHVSLLMGLTLNPNVAAVVCALRESQRQEQHSRLAAQQSPLGRQPYLSINRNNVGMLLNPPRSAVGFVQAVSPISSMTPGTSRGGGSKLGTVRDD